MTASAPVRSLLVALLLLALLLLAPASRARPAEPTPGALAPLLPDSSVAAVLAKRDALQLSPEQVKQLEQVQARLAKDQRAARETPSIPPETAPGGSAPPPPPRGAGPGPAGGGNPGGVSGGKSHPPPNVRGTGPSQAQLLEQQLDALDTEAFLKAVELLPEAQREQAIGVASRYREQLFEQRERDRKR
jgi:hypothetical protein